MSFNTTHKSVPYSSDSVRSLASRLIKKYGMEQFLLLLELFQRGESCTKIGYAFSVSRQRASQWQMALGEKTVVYNIHPVVEHLVGKRDVL
jgi:hypothetical protein